VSRQLINRNHDLRQLREDGYDVDIVKEHLIVRGVPYVNSARGIACGTLVVQELRLAGDKTLPPTNHVVAFTGDQPCDKEGRPIDRLGGGPTRAEIAPDLITVRTFSSKPEGGYLDYHAMLTTYIGIISNPAKAIDDTVTAQRYLPYETEPEESVFCYADTASSRAGLTSVNAKLDTERIGIVGVGGAGSYVLDYIAKTGVPEIHLFDGDHLETHNAFRAPGAVSLDDLHRMPNKAEYWRDRYAPLRRGIFAHEAHVTAQNVRDLADLTFVFLCLDSGGAKRLIVATLEEMDKPFLDVGIGLEKIDDSVICGQVRTTASLPRMRDHFGKRVDYSDDGNDVYRSNIQITELNALNAALAVVKWKKFRGFYADFERESGSVYMVECNSIANETP
jgi:hypothetical protein